MRERQNLSKLNVVANRDIKADKIQVISHEGENLGIMSTNAAIEMAEDVGLDVVMVSDTGAEGVPVTKMMDVNKKFYEKKKKMIAAKKKQHEAQLKELRISPKIGDHDFNIKIKKCIQFLTAGHRVKIAIIFRGREKSLKDTLGPKMFQRVDEKVREDLVDAKTDKVLSHEKDVTSGFSWSRIYFLKRQ